MSCRQITTFLHRGTSLPLVRRSLVKTRFLNRKFVQPLSVKIFTPIDNPHKFFFSTFFIKFFFSNQLFFITYYFFFLPNFFFLLLFFF
jgi:hypothetical protein